MTHRDALPPRSAWFILLCALSIFAVLATTAPWGMFADFEKSLMLDMRASAPQWMIAAAADWTVLGGTAFLVLLSLVCIGLFVLRGEYDALFILAIVVIGENLLTSFLKAMFARERPDFLDHLVDATNASFPSGHSSSAAAVYMTLGLLLANRSSRRTTRRYILSVAALIAALVGMSRVILGVHYPSDVLAGWAVGAGWAAAVWLFAAHFSKAR